MAGEWVALLTWLGSRLFLMPFVVVVAWAAGLQAEERQNRPGEWLLFRFAHWDSHLYSAIAIRGYPRVDYPHSYFSFLPGFPWLLRYLSPPGVEVRWTGLVLVTLCGAVSAVLLWWLALDMTGLHTTAQWSVIAYAVAPLTVFFSVVYTEATFTALALGAWLAGRKQRWGWAGLLASLACALRVTGPLLVVGLVAMYLIDERSGRLRWRIQPAASALGLGPLFIASYFVWLHAQTGRWDAWTEAQRRGFGRATAPPWTGLADAVHKVATADSGHLLAVRLMELTAPVLAWLAVVWMVRCRWWPEAVYAALCAFSMSFSTIWDSSPRYLHAVFPLYVLLGAWLAGHGPAWRAVWVGVSSAVASALAVMWAMQWWLA